MQAGFERAAVAGNVRSLEDLPNSGVDVDALDRHGQTALMLAIVAGHGGVARALVHAGAGLTIRGSGAHGFSGMCAYDLAAKLGMKKLCSEIAARSVAAD